MSDLVKPYFACSNTAKGFKNFFDSNLKNLDKIYILKGGPGTGKSTLMKKIASYVQSYSIPTEFIYCSSDSDSLDGLIIRSIKTAIVDGTSPHVIEPTAPGAIEEYINLGVAWDINALTLHKKEILFLQTEISSCYPKAYDLFSKALNVHDDWESIYINQMNFAKANELTNTLIQNLLPQESLNKKSTLFHRFFGASTCKGPINFIPQLTEGIKNQYFIKGRPGTGKSTLLKKILISAQTKGLDVEVYHCSLDPDSLDMLLFPELSLLLFDSTAPHEYFASKPNQHTIDLYSELITPHTDELYKSELDTIKSKYKAIIQEGTSHLAYAKYLHDDLEKYYIQATDFTVIDTITQSLIEKIAPKLNLS